MIAKCLEKNLLTFFAGNANIPKSLYKEGEAAHEATISW